MRKNVAFIIVAFLMVACSSQKSSAWDGLLTDTLVIETKDGQAHEFEVALALTADQQAKGLMNKTDMEDMSGMLFWFGGEEATRSFWMKNTLMPLDMIFIKRDGRIHHIHKNARPYDLSPHPSKGAVAAVLEINGGMADKLGISTGDVIKQRFFK